MGIETGQTPSPEFLARVDRLKASHERRIMHLKAAFKRFLDTEPYEHTIAAIFDLLAETRLVQVSYTDSLWVQAMSTTLPEKRAHVV